MQLQHMGYIKARCGVPEGVPTSMDNAAPKFTRIIRPIIMPSRLGIFIKFATRNTNTLTFFRLVLSCLPLCHVP